MIATKTEHHNTGPAPKIRKIKMPVPPAPDLPSGGSAANWNEATRRAVALRLMEHLDDGVELASQLCNDPSFASPDERVTTVLTVARMINANAHLGRAIATFAQVEKRRRTVIKRAERPLISTDSNSILEAELASEMTLKMMRYMKVVADETFDPAIQEAEEAKKKAADDAAPAAGTPSPATSNGANENGAEAA